MRHQTQYFSARSVMRDGDPTGFQDFRLLHGHIISGSVQCIYAFASFESNFLSPHCLHVLLCSCNCIQI